jgi:type I restriction enzyme R subunit
MNEPPRRNYKTKSGRIVTDADFEALATEAEKGYDVSDLQRRPGRPLIGSSPAIGVPIRMHADLLAATQALADAEETSVSELVRDAVGAYLSTEPARLEFRTASGRTLTDAEFERLADEAERGYDLAASRRKLKRRSGVRAEVVPVRMPPELKDALERRAEKEETSVSEVVREALRARIGGEPTDPPGGSAASRPRRRQRSQGGRTRTDRGHTGPSTGGSLARPHRLGPRERDTCRDYVLPRLHEAGWSDEQIVEQYRITDGRIVSVGSKHRRADPLRADYVLEYRPGLPVAVVEAKREYSIPGKGMQQAKNYAELLDLPFSYATNGRGMVEDDRDTGRETENLNAFPTPDELWMRYRAFKGLDVELAADGVALPFNRSLRNFDGTVKESRYYQRTAINRAVAAILGGDKRLLLTMATGTGKTFVAMQIVWKLWSAGWRPGRHPRILYLADRNILINQPRLDYFVPAFGDGPVWTLRGGPKSGREIYFALYQAIADGREDDGIFRSYAPDYFDLVIVDECHRGSASAESAWRRILEHFSPATQLGMTATPKRDETADSYAYFGNPLYEYSLAQGIEDGFLAPYRVRRVVLSPDAHGWSPTEGQLDLFGKEIPDGLYTTSQFERVVSLLSRTEAAARHLTDYLKRTDRWAKTIVFCVDQEHAHQMRQALHNANSDLTKHHPNYVVRIVSDEGEIGAGHLGSFADTESDTPVIATTSQLLSTGVDLPTVKNIVLFRPVGSMALFKQMIGRGTRLFPDADKLSFDILDYSGATALFADPEFDGPPERVDREEIDETGAVVEDVVVEQPEPAFGDGEQPEGPDIDESQVEPRAKFYVNDTEVWVTAEAIYHLDPATQRLRLVEYREYVADTVRTLFPEPAELRTRWQTRVGRQEVRDALVARGVDIDELPDRIGLVEADPLDILVHLAWNQPVATRRDRTRRIRKEHADFFDAHQPAAREVLGQLLDKYAEYGIGQLDDLGVLEVPPLSALGSPAEIAGRFGSPAALREAVEELGELLYAA